jgi:hypothetical protein
MKTKALILIIILAPFICYSQRSVELTATIGYTGVDIEGIVEVDEISGTEASDWGQLNGGVSGQLFLSSAGDFGFGIELMYHHLYWYSVEVPYGYYDIYREYSINAFRITPIIRYGPDNMVSIDLGPELNFLDGLRVGLMTSVNYNISVSDRIYVPIKLRFDIIDYIKPVVPISLNAGVRVKI